MWSDPRWTAFHPEDIIRWLRNAAQKYGCKVVEDARIFLRITIQIWARIAKLEEIFGGIADQIYSVRWSGISSVEHALLKI